MTSGTDSRSPGALAGLRVIDFGQGVSAPHCARLFADYGADVIKVEPRTGDAARHSGPYPGDLPDQERSGLFFFHNTNKRGVTCQVEHPEGRRLFLDLVSKADVLMSLKGIGLRTACFLIAGLPELGCIDKGQIAKLVGVAPLNRCIRVSTGLPADMDLFEEALPKVLKAL